MGPTVGVQTVTTRWHIPKTFKTHGPAFWNEIQAPLRTNSAFPTTITTITTPGNRRGQDIILPTTHPSPNHQTIRETLCLRRNSQTKRRCHPISSRHRVKGGFIGGAAATVENPSASKNTANAFRRIFLAGITAAAATATTRHPTNSIRCGPAALPQTKHNRPRFPPKKTSLSWKSQSQTNAWRSRRTTTNQRTTTTTTNNRKNLVANPSRRHHCP